MRPHPAFLPLWLSAIAVPSAAQTPPPLEVGALARLSVACPPQARGGRCKPLVGTIAVLDADSLTLRLADDQTRRVAWRDVDEVAISRRTKGHADLGFLAGAGAGVLVGALWKSSCEKDAGEYAGLCGLSYLFTVPAGALIGTVTGALTRSPVWEVAPVAVPSESSFGLALRIRF